MRETYHYHFPDKVSKPKSGTMASDVCIWLQGLACNSGCRHRILRLKMVQTILEAICGICLWEGCRLCHKLGLAVLGSILAEGLASSVPAQFV